MIIHSLYIETAPWNGTHHLVAIAGTTIFFFFFLGILDIQNQNFTTCSAPVMF